VPDGLQLFPILDETKELAEGDDCEHDRNNDDRIIQRPLRIRQSSLQPPPQEDRQDVDKARDEIEGIDVRGSQKTCDDFFHRILDEFILKRASDW